MDSVVLYSHFAVVGATIYLLNVPLSISLYSYYADIAQFTVYIILACSTYHITKRTLCKGKIKPKGKTVLITGKTSILKTYIFFFIWSCVKKVSPDVRRLYAYITRILACSCSIYLFLHNLDIRICIY